MNKSLKLYNQISKPTANMIILSLFCILLITASAIRSANITYYFLGWNLFLAWIPLLVAKLWKHRLNYEPLQSPKGIVLFSLWLLFLPNAPYIITDLIHLNHRFNPSFWSDTLLLFSCAFTGLMVGLYSTYIVHKILDRHFSKVISWFIIATAQILCGFGVYLGRVQRWNSWDLFTRPFELFQDLIIQINNPLALNMTLGFSSLIFIIYFLLKSVIGYESIGK